MYGRICWAPKAQFRPTLNGRACSDRDIERVERLARERPSTAIGDGRRDHQWNSTPRASNSSCIPAIAALAFSVSKIGFEQQQVDAAVDQPAHLLAIRLPNLRECRRPNAGLLTSGEIESVRLVGPIAPATKRGRSGVFAVHSSAALRPAAAASTFSS